MAVAANILNVLCPAGDLTIAWNPASEPEAAEARRVVAELQVQGYQFFRVDGSPAEDTSGGIDVLSCRRIEAAEVVTPVEAGQPRRRGRPRKQPATEPTHTVASRPLQGG